MPNKNSKKVTLPETNSLPLKIGHPKKGNNRNPTIHFGATLVLGRVASLGFDGLVCTQMVEVDLNPP